MTPRERILERLAKSGPGESRPAPDVAAFYRAHRRDESPAQRVARFTAAMVEAHAEVHPTDTESWPALLWRLAAEKGVRRLLTGARSQPVERLAASVPEPLRLVAYDRPVEAWKSDLFQGIDAGLSVARSAIAETGTLVLWPGPDEPRLLSLVPPIHFVLLDAGAIHADFHAAMMAEAWAEGLPTNALLISGPSKTADIQQVLAYGAHGPRELIVLLCATPGSAQP